ncbi:AraC family transcriptional regulator ligand-binding domain-containing protein [Pseudochrobactrum algeriensis]|uniref:AraC family transcriptional regulator ligand-binding domain-containing protein n=1 Tax=Pseudochrobactrum algeriensis TaxID=2834768 RepID=UPI001EE55CF4|nr:AraC family transcriptional regulator ligand-binding domain-containing protein [Pseudochrobactrum algeriensis]
MTSSHTGKAAAVIPATFVHCILLAYAKYGTDPAAALKKAQIPPEILADENGRVTPDQFEDLNWEAMQELDDEALGWFSRKLPWGTYGMLCRASLGAATLGIALHRWKRHHSLLTDDVLLNLDIADGIATISITEARDLGACPSSNDLRLFVLLKIGVCGLFCGLI